MEGGEAIGLRASAVRNLVRLLEGPPTFYVPAIVSILAPRRNQRLGDLAAGTLVIREPRAGAAPRRAARRPPRDRRRRACGLGGLGRLGDHAAGAGRGPLVPRAARVVHARRPPRARARPRRPARRQGRRPAPRAPRRDAARGHRGGEVRPILNTQRTREGGSQRVRGVEDAARQPAWASRRQAPQQAGPAAAGPAAPGFWRRFAALFIDGLILASRTASLILLLDDQLAQLLTLIIDIAYFAYLEGGPTGPDARQARARDPRDRPPGRRPDRLRPRRVRYLGADHLHDPALPGVLLDAVGPREAVLAGQDGGLVVVPVDAYPVR